MRVAPQLTAIALFATAPLTAQSTPLWRYTATAPISLVRVTPLGNVVVATADGLVSLDPDSGTVIWIRDDLRNLEPASYATIRQSPFATVQVGERVELIDLFTGATKWSTPPSADLEPYLPIPERGLILANGSKDSAKHVLVAFELESGRVRWERVQPFKAEPEALGQDCVGLQPALWVSDSTFILYVSKDGPALVHAGTGAWLWRSDSLAGRRPPAPGMPVGGCQGKRGLLLIALTGLDASRNVPRAYAELVRSHATMLLADSVVYVPFEKRLQAIRTRDGVPLWGEAPEFPTPIAQLELAVQGIVVRGQPGPTGKSWLDVIDPATGTSRWSTPSRRTTELRGVKDITPFVVSEGRVYVAANEKLLAVSLDDGTATEVTRFKFEGDEQPFLLERREDGLLLIGNQNLMLLDSTGAERCHAYHPAPRRSTLANVGLGVLAVVANAAAIAGSYLSTLDPDSPLFPLPSRSGSEPHFWLPNLGVRYAASEQARNYVYSVAHEEDSTGHKRPVFLRLHKDDGRVTGRVWLDEKRPEYALDRVTGMLYVKSGDTAILAFKM